MPKWGIEMQEGTLTEWLVQEGETISKGQLIALIETDKITNEMEADAPGVVHKLLVPEGEVKTVGQLLAILGDEGCLLYTSPSPRDQRGSRMPSSA